MCDSELHQTKHEKDIRKKQQDCIHPSFKCSLCGIYQDNLFNLQKEQIRILRKLVIYYEQELTRHEEPVIPLKYMESYQVFDTLIKMRRINYEICKKNGTLGSGGFMD